MSSSKYTPPPLPIPIPMSPPSSSSSSSSCSPSSLHLPPLISRLRHFSLYETKLRYLLIGSNPQYVSSYKILKIDRFSPVELSLESDDLEYSAESIHSILNMTNAIKMYDVYGIIGFVRVVSGYYLHVITGIGIVGEIGKHQIFTITETQLLYIPHQSIDLSAVAKQIEEAEKSQKNQNNKNKNSNSHPNSLNLNNNTKVAVESAAASMSSSSSSSFSSSLSSLSSSVSSFLSLSSSSSSRSFFNPKIEQKYKSLFLLVEMSKNFYFSYSYNLSQTLQYNMIHSEDNIWNSNRRENFIWNSHQLEPLATHPKYKKYLNEWTVDIIHGFVQQNHLSVFGRLLSLILISRRSRLFAGTRYLKRGLNDDGCVANDVETEQLVGDRSSENSHYVNYSSHVQMRGSIPVHWSQEGSAVVAQPAILIQKLDPLHLSTRNHVSQLFERYGSPLLMLNLIKQNESRKRESIVGSAFHESIEFINQWLPQQHKISYLPWDFKKVAKSKTQSVVDELAVIAHWALQKTGIFHSFPSSEAIKLREKEMESPLSSPFKIDPTRESLQYFVKNLPERRSAGKAERLLGAFEAFEAASAITMATVRERETAGEDSEAKGESPAMSAIAWAQQQIPTFSLSPTSSSPSSSAALPSPPSHPNPNSHKNNNNFPSHSTPSSSSPFYPTDSPRHVGKITMTNHSPKLKFTSTELFPSPSPSPSSFSVRHVGFIQRGVCRSNCIDSLDRTNVAAFCIGKCALGYQFHCLGLIDSQNLPGNSDVVNLLLSMYETMGDALAFQYGGSQMHRQMKKDREKTMSMAPVLYKQSQPTKPKEILVSLMRHYQNSFQDTSKQDAINVFLGIFQPAPLVDNAIDIWDLQSDYYLHNTHLCTATNKYHVEATYLQDEWWRKPLEKYERNLLHYSRIAITGQRTISTVDLNDIIHLPTRGRGGGGESLEAKSPRGNQRAKEAKQSKKDRMRGNTPESGSNGGITSSVDVYSAIHDVPIISPISHSPEEDLFFVSAYGPSTIMTLFDEVLMDPLQRPKELHLLPPVAEEKKKGFTTYIGERIRNGLRMRKMKEGDVKGGEEEGEDDKWMELEQWGKKEVRDVILQGTESEVWTVDIEDEEQREKDLDSLRDRESEKDKERERDKEREKMEGKLIVESPNQNQNYWAENIHSTNKKGNGNPKNTSASSSSSSPLNSSKFTLSPQLSGRSMNPSYTSSYLSPSSTSPTSSTYSEFSSSSFSSSTPSNLSVGPPFHSTFSVQISFSEAVKNVSPSYLLVSLRRPRRDKRFNTALPDANIGLLSLHPSQTQLEQFYSATIHLKFDDLLVHTHQVALAESLKSLFYSYESSVLEKKIKSQMKFSTIQKESNALLSLLLTAERESMRGTKRTEDDDGNVYDERFDLDPAFLSEENIFDIPSHTGAAERAKRKKERQMEEIKEIVVEKSKEIQGRGRGRGKGIRMGMGMGRERSGWSDKQKVSVSVLSSSDEYEESDDDEPPSLPPLPLIFLLFFVPTS